MHSHNNQACCIRPIKGLASSTIGSIKVYNLLLHHLEASLLLEEISTHLTSQPQAPLPIILQFGCTCIITTDARHRTDVYGCTCLCTNMAPKLVTGSTVRITRAVSILVADTICLAIETFQLHLRLHRSSTTGSIFALLFLAGLAFNTLTCTWHHIIDAIGVYHHLGSHYIIP
jgi:hypothetical protein